MCYVMLCYVMLCYVMLCYVMLCYVMLCYKNDIGHSKLKKRDDRKILKSQIIILVLNHIRFQISQTLLYNK